MSEPIAVAFVEVRPETDEFRTDTERELAGLGDDFTVRGDVELQGLDQARRDVEGLAGALTGLPTRQLRFDGLGQARDDVQSLREGLGDLSGQQLQFAGLEDAIQDTEALREGLVQVSAVDISRPVQGFTTAVDQIANTGAFASLASDAHAAGEALGAAGEHGHEAAEGVGHADAAVLEANAALVEAGISGQKFGGSMAQAGKIATSGMQAAAAATREETVAINQAAAAEENLVRVRSRRASAVGAFRFAGVGLIAGSAIFGLTKAIGDLQNMLVVTGNEAATFQGKLRNTGAALLSGDVVGALKALTNETVTYGHEQLEIINETPRMTAELLEAGRGADLLRSRLEELAHVGAEPVAQFIQAQIAQARQQNDPRALRAALEKASEQVDEALDEAKELRGPQKELTEEIKSRREELTEVREQLANLDSAQADRLTFNVQTGQVGTVFDNLKKREQTLVDELNAFVQQRDGTLPAFHAAEESLANAKREQEAAIDEAIAAEAESVLAPLAEAVTDAALTGDANRILAALRREAAGLRRVIEGFEGSAEDRKKFKDDLLALNRTIESTQKEIADEAERHRQAMIDARLAPSEEAVIDAELSGASVIPALQARANDIQSILATGLINGKKISRDQRVALKNELKQVNGQIESEQDRIAAETERHKTEMKSKLDAADQAFLDTIGGREAQLRNEQAIEQGRAGLAGDIRVSNELQAFFRESIRLARATIQDKKLRDETVADLQRQAATEAQNERQLRQQQRRDRRERRAESLDLDIEIAEANDNTRAEVRARRAKIAFLREQIETTRRGSVERKRLRAEIAAERQAIRELNKDKEESDSDSATTLADLFTQATEIGRQRSIDTAQLPIKAGDVTQPIEDEVTARLKAQTQVEVKSPFERTGDKVATSNDKLRESIDRLTATIPNLTGSTLGGPPAPTRGEVEGARWNEAARFWQSRQGKQLAQETASA